MLYKTLLAAMGHSWGSLLTKYPEKCRLSSFSILLSDRNFCHLVSRHCPMEEMALRAEAWINQ